VVPRFVSDRLEIGGVGVCGPVALAGDGQHVLDDRPHPIESVAGLFGVLDVPSLLEEFEIALSDAEWIAEVVADDPSERIESLVAFAKLPFASLSLRDVAEDTYRAEKLTVGNEDRDLSLAGSARRLSSRVAVRWFRCDSRSRAAIE